jgi:hypothetical protein
MFMRTSGSTRSDRRALRDARRRQNASRVVEQIKADRAARLARRRSGRLHRWLRAHPFG